MSPTVAEDMNGYSKSKYQFVLQMFKGQLHQPNLN